MKKRTGLEKDLEPPLQSPPPWLGSEAAQPSGHDVNPEFAAVTPMSLYRHVTATLPRRGGEEKGARAAPVSLQAALKGTEQLVPPAQTTRTVNL
jgi:hypothetical protein